MAMILLLKALWDLSFYYLFAAPIAAFFGGENLLWIGLFQCILCTLAQLPKRRGLGLLILSPMVLCFFGSTPADWAAMVPAGLYILWQVLTQRAIPDIDRQRELFERQWKIAAVAVAAAAFIVWLDSFHYIFTDTMSAAAASGLKSMVFFAVLFLLGAITLMRTLRHSPEVYLQPRFQAVNLATVAVVPAAAALLAFGNLPAALGAGFRLLYRTVLAPLLFAILCIPVNLFLWIMEKLLPDTPPNQEEPLNEIANGLEEFQNQVQWELSLDPALRAVLIAAAALAAAVGLFLLFRWLRGRKGNASVVSATEEIRTAITSGNSSLPTADRTIAGRIRRQYRRFLKLCVRESIRLTPGSTSLDVDAEARRHTVLRTHSSRIRQLYIRARYAGSGTKEDLRLITRLVNETKKER